LYFLRTIGLLDNIINNNSKEILYDTIHMKEFQGSGLFSDFKNVIFQEFKTDSLYSNSHSDTMLIINIPLLQASIGLRRLVIDRYDSYTNDCDKGLKINPLLLSSDPIYLEEIKKLLKKRTIEGIEESSPGLLNILSDSQIEKMVEEQIKMLINSVEKIIQQSIEKYEIDKKNK